jgi:hypothetical protein
MEYASKGVANAGLTTGIIGSALGAMNSGILPSLFGNSNCGCSENMLVNRYEAAQSARIAELETEVKLRDANTYTDSKLGALRDYVDGKFSRVEHELCDQKVYNATLNGAVGCIQGQIAQLMSLTKLVIPNGSVCPGWGDVTVSITPAPTTGA